MRTQNIKYYALDISGMEECKMPAWTSDKMFWYPIEGSFIPRTAIFQRRASF
jgi:hypothetical protein